ncbi:MAG TPA: sortase [Candidatus Paceibacterota bacterium]|nr:sortase [Candidatus Paceibacterota bacterium]
MKRKPKVIYLPGVFERILAKKWSFLGVFVVVYFFSFNFLAGVGIAPGAFAFRPDPVEVPVVPTENDALILPEGQGELPVRIEIPKVGIQATVSNPNTTDVATLDRELLAGAVRYPGSGTLGENGNVLMFGHSSHLPVVHNQAFKAFNDIQNLEVGDPIFVFGKEKIYVYAVEKVEAENTTTGAIPLDITGAKLTLATCDNFGTKSDRFVVTAVLVSIQDQKSQ